MSSSRLGWTLTIAATLTMTVSYFDRQALGALGPKVRAGLEISNTQFGWLVSAFSIAYLIASPLAGAWIDRVGPRRGLLVAVLAWTAVSALHGAVPNFAALFALRIALGLTEAPSFPGAAQTVQRALPREQRSRGFGVLFMGSSIGALLAPLAATTIEKHFGFRVAFLVTALAGLSWIPMWLVVTRGKEARARLGEAELERAARVPLVERLRGLARALGHPAVQRGAIVVVTSAPMIGFVLNWTANVLKDTYGIPQEDMAKYLWLPPVLFDLGSVSFGFLASRAQKRGVDTPRALLLGAGVIGSAMPVALLLGDSPWAMTIALGVALVGGGGLFSVLTSDMLSRVPAPILSSASGLSAAAQSLAYIVANPLVGWARDRTGGFAAPILGLSVIVLPGAIAWALWPPPPKVIDEEARE
ncbi:MAG: MFS transporter [Polyangiaceae bacterium]